jgi:DNA-binding transcriptional MerR regulator
MNGQILTTSDAAKRLDLTPAAVRSLARQGTLRVAIVTVSGQRLFESVEVDRLAMERAQARQAKEVVAGPQN